MTGHTSNPKSNPKLEQWRKAIAAHNRAKASRRSRAQAEADHRLHHQTRTRTGQDRS